jgi:hypothetical protein
MKSLIEFINESYSSKTIQEFFNLVKTYKKDKLYISILGGGIKKYVNGWEVNTSDTSNQKFWQKFFSKEFRLGSFKEDWIYRFKQFDNNKIVNRENLIAFWNTKEFTPKNIHDWCGKNNTMCFFIHDKNNIRDSEYIEGFFINPEKASSVVKMWKEIADKKSNTHNAAQIDNENNYKQNIANRNNFLLNTYKEIASKEQYKELINFIKWYTGEQNFEFVSKYVSDLGLRNSSNDLSFNDYIKLLYKDIDEKSIKKLRVLSKRQLQSDVLQGMIGDLLYNKFERLYKSNDARQGAIGLLYNNNPKCQKMFDDLYDFLHKDLDTEKLNELKKQYNKNKK